MLFEKRIKELEKFNLEEPIAFKVKITKDEQFTRMNIMKIEDLKKAKKEKIDTKKVIEAQPPLVVGINFFDESNNNSDDITVITKLEDIARRYYGHRELHIVLKSKLVDIYFETKLRVGNKIVDELAQIDIFEVK
jgi:DNA polymerase-3 subunit alpha